MSRNIYLYLAVMFAVVYAIRVLPLTLFHSKIKSPFLRSFLYYLPYITIAVMTFPAIVEASSSPVAGAAALAVGIILAWRGAGLFPVAVACCAAVFLLELILV